MSSVRPPEVGFVYTESMTNPVRAAEIFREMRDMGATAVAVHAYEQDLHRLPKDVPRIHEAATRASLRRYVSLARLGGMFAGLHTVPDVYTYLHPECRVTPITRRDDHAKLGMSGNQGLSGHLACVNDPGFKDYALQYVDGLVRQLAPDGLILDEPQGVARPIVCLCERCQSARRPDETQEEAQYRFRVDFLSDLCAKARERSPKIRTTMVAAVGLEKPENFQRFARVRGLDAIGIEPFWAFVGKDPVWVEEACASGVERVRAVDREIDIWAQNFGLDTAHQEDLPSVYRSIGAARPDAIWSFWWWRACDDPAAVMRLTREGLASILS